MRVPRASRATLGAVYSAAGAFAWLSPVPTPLAAAVSVAIVFLAGFHFRDRNKRVDVVRALRLEPLGRLSVLVGRRDGEGPRRLMRVRNFSVPRLLHRYVELLLELDGGRKTAIVVFPGITSGDAFRRLRKFVLSSNVAPVTDGARFLDRLAGKLVRFLFGIRRRSDATRMP